MGAFLVRAWMWLGTLPGGPLLQWLSIPLIASIPFVIIKMIGAKRCLMIGAAILVVIVLLGQSDTLIPVARINALAAISLLWQSWWPVVVLVALASVVGVAFARGR